MFLCAHKMARIPSIITIIILYVVTDNVMLTHKDKEDFFKLSLLEISVYT